MRSANVPFALLAVLAAGCTSVQTDEQLNFMFAPDTGATKTTVLDSKLERLEKLAKEYPRRSDLPYQIAGVHFQKENLKESARSLQRAIYIDPGEAKYHYHLGRIYLKMRELEKAEESFRRAIDLMPEGRYTGGHAALGYVLCQKGQFAAARSEFETCARIDPRDPNPHYFLGCIADAKRDRERAVHHLREYLLRGGKDYLSKASRILESYGVEPPEVREGLIDSAPAAGGTAEAAGEAGGALPAGEGRGFGLGDFPLSPSEGARRAPASER
jgi:tetratricopeptide (TPR) repeat protein